MLQRADFVPFRPDRGSAGGGPADSKLGSVISGGLFAGRECCSEVGRRDGRGGARFDRRRYGGVHADRSRGMRGTAWAAIEYSLRPPLPEPAQDARAGEGARCAWGISTGCPATSENDL